jgi:hypothetical protein
LYIFQALTTSVVTVVSRCHSVLPEDPHLQKRWVQLEEPFLGAIDSDRVKPASSHCLTASSRSSQYLISLGLTRAWLHSSWLYQRTIGPALSGNPYDLS